MNSKRGRGKGGKTKDKEETLLLECTRLPRQIIGSESRKGVGFPSLQSFP